MGSVVLMSHLGRPKDKPEAKFSLRQIITCLNSHLSNEVVFLTIIGKEAFVKTANLNPEDVVLLENLEVLC